MRESKANNGLLTAGLMAGYGLLWTLAPLLALAGPAAVGQLGQIHNADSLLIPAVYDDLFVTGYGLDGWKFPGSLYFYPDLFLYIPLRAVGGSTVAGAALFAHVQFAAFLLLWTAVLRQCVPWSERGRLHTWLGPALPTFVVCIAYSGRPEAFLDLFRMAHHTGAALVSLLALYLTLRWLRTSKKYLLVLLFVNAGLASLSDQIFLVMGLLPLLPVLFGRFRRPVLWAGAVQLAAVLLMEPVRRSLYQVFRIRNFIGPAMNALKHESAPAALARGIGDFARAFADYYGTPFTILFVLCFALCLVAGIAVIFAYLRRSDSRAPATQFAAPDAVGYLLFYMITVAPLLIVASIVVGLVHYGKPFQPRYLALLITAPFFLLPLLGFFFLGRKSHSMKPFGRMVSVWVPVALLGMLMVFLPQRFSPARLIAPFQFEHTTANCLDHHAQKLNLKYGLGDYWAAKPVTLFSRTGLRVNQLEANLNVYYWINNINWYLEKEPVYDFLILDRLNEKAVARAFGKPAGHLDCGPSRVLIYNRPEKDARFRKHYAPNKLRLWRMLTGND